MDLLDERKKRYDAARDAESKARAYLEKVTEKRLALADGLPALEAAAGQKREAAERALARYVVDDLPEQALTEARREVADLESRYGEQKGMLDALAGEVEKARAAHKEAQAAATKTRQNLLAQIAEDETTKAREAAEMALKRAYLAQLHAAPGGYADNIREVVAKTFELIHVSETERRALFDELAEDYGL